MTTLIAIQVKNRFGAVHNVKLEELPDSCPICHFGMQAIGLGCEHLSDEIYPKIIERVFRCSLKACQRMFIATYRQQPSGIFELWTCRPQELMDTAFPQEIKDVSPDFCAIWNEAHKAEQSSWLLVCGPGYRKALEFLIKDYVTREHQTDAAAVADIEKLQLMPCIRKYVSDANIKTTAERAAWLGNDETHYVRKWEDKELKDLKNLIQLVCYWVQSSELTKGFTTSMPQGKP